MPDIISKSKRAIMLASPWLLNFNLQKKFHFMTLLTHFFVFSSEFLWELSNIREQIGHSFISQLWLMSLICGIERRVGKNSQTNLIKVWWLVIHWVVFVLVLFVLSGGNAIVLGYLGWLYNYWLGAKGLIR